MFSFGKLKNNHIIFRNYLIKSSTTMPTTQPNFSVLYSGNTRCTPSNAQITYSVTNHSDKSYYLSYYFNPLEGVTNENIVNVVDLWNNVNLPYIGPMCRRYPPSEYDFRLIGPGETVSSTFQVSGIASIQPNKQYRVESGSGCRKLTIRDVLDDQRTEQQIQPATTSFEFST